MNLVSTNMAAAEELRCVDRDVLEDIDSAFILKEEQRNARHLSIEKMFLPSFLRDPVKV